LTFLGIDIGSSGVKAQTIGEEGRMLENAFCDVSNLLQRPEPTWAERDPEALWMAVCRALRSMAHLQEVEALSVAATSGSVVAADGQLKPLSPILLYSDKRAQAETRHIRQASATARAYEPYVPLDASLATPKILWLKHNMPNFREVKVILNETDYVQSKLTGEVCTSPSIAGKMHVDVRSGEYLKEIFRDIEIDPTLLPPIRPTGSVVGEVTRQAYHETGIATGALLVNGVTDATAADIATGSLREGQVNISIGTSLVAHAVVANVLPDHEKRIYYKSYVDGRLLAGGATDAGTLPLSGLARLLGRTVQELDSMAAAVPPTCDGLLAQPQWIGSRIPYHNPRVRGFFVGITDQNLFPGHLYRSLLEGNGFVTKQVLDVVQGVTGVEPKELRTSGGASRSDIQNQIIADVTGKHVSAVETNEASIGSAMMALNSVKGLLIADVAELVVRMRRSYTPNQDTHLAYKQTLSNFATATERLFK
jgi:sugar (pentulose or hexulose) kinase